MTPGPDDHLYVTLDDNESRILELVLSNDRGMFIRSNGQWVQIDPEADNNRVWDRIVRDVKPAGIKGFDDVEKSDGIVALTRMQPYLVPEGADA